MGSGGQGNALGKENDMARRSTALASIALQQAGLLQAVADGEISAAAVAAGLALLRDGKKVAEKDLLLYPEPSYWLAFRQFAEQLQQLPWLQPQTDPDPAWRVYDTLHEADLAVAALDNNVLYSNEVAEEDMVGRLVSVCRQLGINHRLVSSKCEQVFRLLLPGVPVRASEDATHAALLECCWSFGSQVAQAVDARDAATIGQRFAVWRAGYGLYDQVDGQLYVYRSAQ
jgi:hypothetical protein